MSHRLYEGLYEGLAECGVHPNHENAVEFAYKDVEHSVHDKERMPADSDLVCFWVKNAHKKGILFKLDVDVNKRRLMWFLGSIGVPFEDADTFVSKTIFESSVQ
ncbi:hypothetical protein BTO32_15565 [Marinobacter lutaoensis]|uniref:Uncharacterized protein n=1 Tax=Marinobacter lutaoensis TaxID=135739 RepID=A0A1V2DQF3_9GAMM|nr:hypothetical protein [Marinobacter lutaoensis]ONF42621.1 hypothetical protein BTO32_15565 [Marinobacter lutaoensis]